MNKTKLSYLELIDICKGLIGREVEVINATDKSLIGVKGRIIDETLKTFKIKQDSRIKVVPKNAVRLKISLPSGEIEINGNLLMQRPEERIKKWWQKIRRRMKWKKRAQTKTVQSTGT